MKYISYTFHHQLLLYVMIQNHEIPIFIINNKSSNINRNVKINSIFYIPDIYNYI